MLASIAVIFLLFGFVSMGVYNKQKQGEPKTCPECHQKIQTSYEPHHQGVVYLYGESKSD